MFPRLGSAGRNFGGHLRTLPAPCLHRYRLAIRRCESATAPQWRSSPCQSRSETSRVFHSLKVEDRGNCSEYSAPKPDDSFISTGAERKRAAALSHFDPSLRRLPWWYEWTLVLEPDQLLARKLRRKPHFKVKDQTVDSHQDSVIQW